MGTEIKVLKRAERSVSEEDIIAMTEIMDAESLQNNEEWSMEDTEQRSYKTIEHGLKSSIRTSMSPMPIIVKFEDVVLKVILKKSQPSWCHWRRGSIAHGLKHKPKEKVILKGITGIVRPGEMLALLGPSGSGKTSLLSILGGRLGGGELAGNVLYNDQPYSKPVKRRTGFITQDDILHVHLTVKETLVYAALLRLHSDVYTKQDKIRRAQEIIMEPGLERCQDTRIGDAFRREISGGERKRVSIGCELIVDPSLLLLDEPTSGLDSTTASRIISTLQNLANGGRTVISTIHQPSSRVYHMFDKIILLSGGHVLYYGQASEAMNYFMSLGFPPVSETNPADYLLDLANGVTLDMQIGIDESLEPFNEAEDETERHITAQAAIVQSLSTSCERILLPEAKKEVQNCKATNLEVKAFNEKVDWPTSCVDHFHILLVRGLKERRHEAFGGPRVMQVLALSVICRLLWFRTTKAKLQDQVGLWFFFSTFWGFFPLFSALFMFPEERNMLIRERTSGMYKLSAYFFAKTIGDLPLELVLPTVYITIVYSMGGLRPVGDTFFLTLLVLLYSVLVSQGLGLFIGAAMMDAKQATMLASVIMMTFMLAGGFYVQTTPGFISWIKYISFSYYSFKLQLSLQYTREQTYPCATGNCRIEEFQAIRQVGLGDEAICLMALTVMLVGFRVLCYIALRKQKGFC